MRPAARQFHRAAMMALEHARMHAAVNSDLDAAQVVLSLDYGLEMLLKASLLERGKSIMENSRRSIGLLGALRSSGPYKQASNAEVLRERRDGLQHFAQYTDAATTQDLYEGSLLLAEEILATDFGQNLPSKLRVSQLIDKIPTISGLAQVSPSEELQRDVSASGSLVCWAQGVTGSTRLEVWMKRGDGEPLRLTPEDEFEYMPKTDGENVVVYRQSGGIVLYMTGSGERILLSEAGGPSSILGDWIAAQGLSIQGGLGGGIWLYKRSTAKWHQVSESGDSARLTKEHVIWQELEGAELAVKIRELEGGEPKTLVRGGAHPSPWSDEVAWTDWPGGEPILHVTNVAGAEIWSGGPGIFPSLVDDLIVYLAPSTGSYDLAVTNIRTGKTVIDIPGVGFPIGSGPILTKDALYFESTAGHTRHAIWSMMLKLS